MSEVGIDKMGASQFLTSNLRHQTSDIRHPKRFLYLNLTFDATFENASRHMD